MNDEDRAVVREMIIKESIALLIMGAVLWYMGPGKLLTAGLLHRAKTAMGARGSAIDVQVDQFRAEVSRWDHEQAAQKDRRPGRGGPCGCG
jgi:hypothetical protein